MSEPDRALPPGGGRGLPRALAVAAAALALFFSPALLTHGQFAYRDAGRQHLPTKRYLAGEMSRGRLPQWNPYLGLGVPFVADAVNAVQHPFNLLLVALPFEAAFKAWVLLSYLLAAAGAFLWARQLGGDWQASLACGLGFALSGHLVSSSDNLHYLTTLASVPLLLAAGHAWIARGGPGRLALLGGASALCAAGGDPQGWALAVAALPLLAPVLVDRDGRSASAMIGRGLAAALAAAVASAPFILPVLAWVPHSSRADPLPAGEYARWNLHPLRALELAFPHLFRIAPGAVDSELFETYAGNQWTVSPWVLSIYAGAAVTALALLGAASARKARALVLGAAAATWMAMGPNAGFGQIARHLPVLSSLRYWEKLVIWPTLLLGAAAVFGFQRLLRDTGAARRFAAAAGGAGAAALMAGLGAWASREALARLLLRGPDRLQAARELAANLVDGLVAAGLAWAVLALLALAASRGRLPRLVPALLVAVVALDLFAANTRAYLLLPPDAAEPSSPLAEHLRTQPGLQRVITSYYLDPTARPDRTPAEAANLWEARTLMPSWNVPWRIGNFEPYAAMVPLRTSRFRTRAQGQPARYAGLWGATHQVVTRAALEAREMARPGSGEVAAVDPALPAALVRLTHRERAYLAREVVAVDRRAAMAFALDPASAGSDRTVVEGPVPDGYSPPGGEARLVRDEPERVEVRTRSDRPALLVLNDAFADGWSATLDGQAAAILPANYLARGVWVPAGLHLVEFAYRTPMLLEGWAVAAAGAVSLAAAAWRRRAGRGR